MEVEIFVYKNLGGGESLSPPASWDWGRKGLYTGQISGMGGQFYFKASLEERISAARRKDLCPSLF